LQKFSITEQKYKKRAWLTLSIVIALSAFFVVAIVKNIGLDYDFEKFFPQDDPDTKFFMEHRDKFGTDNDFVLVGLRNEDGIFQEDFLAEVSKLTKDLSELKYVTGVISPTNMLYPFVETGGMKMYEDSLLHLSQPEYLVGGQNSDSARIYKDPTLVNTIFSSNGKSISIFVKTEEYLDKDGCAYLDTEISKLRKKYDFDEIHVAGRSVGQIYYVGLMLHDLMIFIGTSIILLIIFLYIAFRSTWGIMVPMNIVLLSNIWILGIMAVLDFPLNLMLVVLPTIMFIVGMSDVIHIVSKYLEEIRLGSPKFKALTIAFKEVGIATLLTSVTTAIGFLTLLFSTIEPLRDFGLFTAIGVMVAYILAFTVLPSILALMKEPNIAFEKKDVWRKPLSKMFIWTMRRPALIIAVFVVITSVSGYFAMQVKKDNYILEDLKETNYLRKEFAFFENEFAGVRPFEMALKVKSDSLDFLNEEVLLEANKIENFLVREYGVGAITSPMSIYKTAELRSGGNFELPGKRMRKFITKKLRKNSDTLRMILTPDFKEARVVGRIGDWGSLKVGGLNRKLETFYKDSINPELLEYKLTGTAELIDKNNQMLATSMITGLLAAFILIALILFIIYRKIWMVLLAMIPNIIPLLIIGGMMGAMGMELKVSTSIIFTIAFGIAVDDTIHFMSKLKLELMKGSSMMFALRRTYLSTGRAIIITTLILCAGFLTLIFSDFLGIYSIGILVSTTLFFAVIADLTLLPVLIMLSTPKVKKNVR
jgi:predicted RND superfamily exporter protein